MNNIENYMTKTGPEALSYKDADAPIIIYQANELLQVNTGIHFHLIIHSITSGF